MQPPSREDLARSGTLEELYDKLTQVGIAPGWNKKVASLWPAPKKNFAPAHWTYEQARGALDAAGRLIEALRRADDSAGARRAARDYLEKYPEGPHADLARSVLR